MCQEPCPEVDDLDRELSEVRRQLEEEKEWHHHALVAGQAISDARDQLKRERDKAQVEAAILRSELIQCAEWLESRPDYTEGDASVSTSARAVLTTLEKGE